MNKKTHNEFAEQVKEKFKGEYTVLGEYKKWNEKIKIRHNKCNTEFEIVPNSFLNRQRCPVCTLENRRRKHPNYKSHEQYVEEVKQARGDIYIFHSKYVNCVTKIDVECKICGKRYLTYPTTLIKKTTVEGCKYCMHAIISRSNKGYKLPKKYTTESFAKIVYDTTDRKYELVGEYEGIKKKTAIKHSECGNIYKVTPDHFINAKTRCPICFGNIKKTTKEFKKEVYELVGNEYTVIGKYKTAREKIKLIHNDCGYEYEVVPDAFLRGTRCPLCFKSKGELHIADYLSRNKIDFYTEFTFNDLLSDLGNPLRFDFAIFKDKNLIKLLEYDGEFHYNEKYYNYKTLKKHDERKDRYCEKNNLSLIRIPYWELNDIDQILDKIFGAVKKKVMA